ncbi:UDP-3-O-(3-hydroxymyristoyl)glucosamine N-acyltransferase [Sulfuritalea sp.]|uniref:UDP-3-O-(3-hydroxymyristoyl)glucosamine N-acyltransferase n=1 Tax=Sulfuritalea sp. TaxID=2480090 RepID=UPI001AD452B7|nr:UDP-3-O-(3-hydroxymyristoyl)glucosamine N-acyltransferase [Sulfuritalea sp.]MBN8474688.1 UDP-3-O-(3-hydroxymyristoyl)glucosamine N-acyltransferase [Sulfuritalea sp.]
MVLRLDEIVARFGGEIVGAGDTAVSRIDTLQHAGPGDLAFLANPKYRHQLATTHAAAVIMAPPAMPGLVAAILTPQPYLYYARVAQWLNPAPPSLPGIHPSAVVEGNVAATASVGANVWVGRGARIGDDVVIGANCSIGEDVEIGDGSRLAANVSIYARCRIGARCLIHSGVVVGADGFGFAREGDGSWVKVPQVGRVVIGDDVEIGAGTTIDRGALGDTVIGDGVKLDNQIQVGHNVRIGPHTAMAGCVGIAGSAVIGARCTVGGAAVILGHLSIADDVNVSAGTLVAKSIPRAGTYSGTVPFLEHGDWLRNFSRLRHLDEMADRIRALEQRLAALEKKS